MPDCNVCGSSNFFTLSDGHSYCSICQTRLDEVEETDEYGLVGNLIKKSQSQKSTQFSENWTTFEAYNIILAKQTDIISNLCNLGDDFKKLVFSIWSLYLDKIEVAFEDNVLPEKKPKINHRVCKRDFNYLIKDEKQQNLTKKKKPEKALTNFRIGNKVIRVKKKKEFIDTDSIISLDEDQIVHDESTYSEFSQQGSLTYDDNTTKNSQDTIDSVKIKNEIYLKSYHDLNSGGKSKIEKEKNILEQIEKEELNLNLAQTDEEKEIIEKRLFSLKEIISLSKITKSLKDYNLINDNEKDQKKNYVRKVINKMTINKTITIIYIAMRLLNVDIYAFDLLRWVNEGSIPFYFTLNLLPQNWLLSEGDYFTFNKTKLIRDLQKNCSTMVNFLSIKKLPLPNIPKLIIRIIDDLNLPFSIAKLINNLYEKGLENNEEINSLFFKKNKGWYLFPDYEIYTIGIIILVLKKIFSINDYHETILSEQLKSTDDFIWSEWEEHMIFKLNCFKKYIYFNSSFNSNFDNTDMLINYLNIEKKNQKPDYLKKNINRNNNVFDKKNNLEKVFEEFVNENNNLKLEPSFYPFKSMTDLILKNFKTNNDDLIKKDFRSKKINYLFENNCEKIYFKEDKFIISNEFEINEKFKFLLELGNFYLQSIEFNFNKKVLYVENNFFKNYYNTNSNLDDKKIEKLNKIEMFIEDFVFKTCYSNNEEIEQVNCKPKTLLI